jgi:hypothetical protein
MNLRQRIVHLMAIGVVLALAASGSIGAPAHSALAQARSASPGAAAARSAFSCPLYYYCDYIFDYGTGLCFKAGTFSGPGNVPNWGRYGCRNVDGSIYNNSPFTLRIYYGPNYHDPHACIKPWTIIRDLFNYDFNSGSGPHNLVIGNDIASSTISLSPCTNPL